MPTAPIQSNTVSPATSGTNAFSSLTSEDFIKIMFSELSRQDPLKPNDTGALLEQMSSLRSIQSDLDLSQKLESVVTQNQLSAAAGLLGRNVTGYTENFDYVQGVVKSVAKTDDGPVLILRDGTRIPFDTIDQLLESPAATTSSGGSGGEVGF